MSKSKERSYQKKYLREISKLLHSLLKRYKQGNFFFKKNIKLQGLGSKGHKCWYPRTGLLRRKIM